MRLTYNESRAGRLYLVSAITSRMWYDVSIRDSRVHLRGTGYGVLYRYVISATRRTHTRRMGTWLEGMRCSRATSRFVPPRHAASAHVRIQIAYVSIWHRPHRSCHCVNALKLICRRGDRAW